MEDSEPILVLAKNYSQFKAGEHWLWENGFFSKKRPIQITDARQLAGLKGKRLFIMDGAESTHFAMELRYRWCFYQRNKVFDMQDTRDRPELTFKITERIES